MLPYLLLSLELLAMRPVPVGTQLHVRLTTTVGSYASKVGSLVSAVLIAPVTNDDETILPEGSTLAGSVKSVGRVGLGIVRETATLELQFDQVTLPDGESFPISVRLEEVENGREHVGPDGSIRGLRSTSSLSYRASGYIRMALSWDIHARLAFWAIKTLIVQVPEPEIPLPGRRGIDLGLDRTDSCVGTPIRGQSSRTDGRRTLRAGAADRRAAVPNLYSGEESSLGPDQYDVHRFARADCFRVRGGGLDRRSRVIATVRVKGHSSGGRAPGIRFGSHVFFIAEPDGGGHVLAEELERYSQASPHPGVETRRRLEGTGNLGSRGDSATSI